MEDAAEQHQHGGGDADLGISGQNADGEGRHRHRDHRPEQRGTAADAVADMPEEDRAERPHEEPDGEDAEGGQQRGPRIVRGEIESADRAREETVDREVVPLHHVAGDAGRDHSAAVTVSFVADHGGAGSRAASIRPPE